MFKCFRSALAATALFSLTLLGSVPAQEFEQEPAIPNGAEIQLHGPIHEAFAQPTDVNPEPGMPVPKDPPPPIPEEPPAERPDGDNVQFIPGYWAWDPETSQFMWVSGTYRNAPPGRQWVPGHWVHTQEGWRWVAGFWAAESQPEMQYTPEPPAPLNVEPNLPAPGDDYSWNPGLWVYRQSRFVWRPGYWAPLRVGYVWNAPRYIWTPTGYIFCDGYWDYPLDCRGVLFAPVCFSRPLWLTAGWCWRPSYVVGFGTIFDSCFRFPGSFHLYFGNYYGPRYAGLGYRPWYTGYGRYDPAFAHYRWRNHAGEGDWLARQRQLYADRGAGRVAVPPRTWSQQTTVINNKTVVNNIANTRVVAPLNQVKIVNKNVNLVRLSPSQAELQRDTLKRTQELRESRSKLEGFRLGASTNAGSRAAELPSLRLNSPPKGNDTIRRNETTLSKPAITNAPGVFPKVTTDTIKPRILDTPSAPRNLELHSSPPKTFSSAPKILDGPAPRSGDFKVETPRSLNVPRSSDPPRNLSVPRSLDAPRTIPAPSSSSRSTPPAPRRSSSLPPPGWSPSLHGNATSSPQGRTLSVYRSAPSTRSGAGPSVHNTSSTRNSWSSSRGSADSRSRKDKK